MPQDPIRAETIFGRLVSASQARAETAPQRFSTGVGPFVEPSGSARVSATSGSLCSQIRNNFHELTRPRSSGVWSFTQLQSTTVAASDLSVPMKYLFVRRRAELVTGIPGTGYADVCVVRADPSQRRIRMGAVRLTPPGPAAMESGTRALDLVAQ